jgi:hypothetical protein
MSWSCYSAFALLQGMVGPGSAQPYCGCGNTSNMHMSAT